MTCGFGHRDAEPVCMIVHSRSLLYAIESKIRRKEHGQVGISSRFRSGCASFLVLSGISIASPVHAISSEWFQHDHGAVRLVSATTVPSEAGLLELGLQFRMKPGWKIYWRSPGDAGFPPHIDWTGSENLAGARIHWPAPMRFSVLGLQTLGYQDQVVFPISAEVFAPERGVSLKAGLRFLTCDDICVPYQTTLNLALPAAPELDTPMAGLIEKWKQRVPGPEARGGLAIDRVESAVSGTDSFLLIRAVSATPFEAPDLFVEGPEAWNFARPDTHLEPDGKAVLMRIDVSGPDESEPRLVGQTLVATPGGWRPCHRTGGNGVEGRCGAAGAGAPRFRDFDPRLGGNSRSRPLGGLILNVMPCVLPVLSIKLLSIVEQGGESKSRIRANFVASAAGIITCFLILGTVAVGLRSAGLAAGWGIQFQQPVFVTLMLVMITLFACNMSGLFEFRLPGMIMDAAATRDTGSGLSGHFLSGVLATLLATPCTAPFPRYVDRFCTDAGSPGNLRSVSGTWYRSGASLACCGSVSGPGETAAPAWEVDADGQENSGFCAGWNSRLAPQYSLVPDWRSGIEPDCAHHRGNHIPVVAGAVDRRSPRVRNMGRRGRTDRNVDGGCWQFFPMAGRRL